MPTTTAATPQPTAALSFSAVTYNALAPDEVPRLQTNTSSASTSHTSSPESRPVDLRSPILEEEEDETSSEAANEPVTPTDNQHPHTFQDRVSGATKHSNPHAFGPTHTQPPLILNTSATPPPPSKTPTTPGTEKPPKTPIQKRPTSASKDTGLKRLTSGLFRRSNSHGAHNEIAGIIQTDGSGLSHHSGSETTLGKHRLLPHRRMSANYSASTTRSNSPPSPGSPTDAGNPNSKMQLHVEEPSKDQFIRRGNRASTGHSLHKFFSKKPHAHEKEPKFDRRHRATSVDLDSSSSNPHLSNPDAKLPERAIWALPAETGIGLKSRRMSLNLPDDFTVDVADLYSEFCDQSKIVGRRGKSLGKGATSKVKLMTRKGCSNELFAVKEFRGKSSNEKSEDYEQKVKSEYSIAKSVHHPNIVETFRLCTHNGRWNHVMEYCDQGDLFGLVTQKYLSTKERQNDRLCLFKQLIQGLNYLHSNGIAHRDIKLENLLITKDSKLKITDFGVSEVFAGIHPGLRAAGGQCGKEMDEVRLCAPGMCGSPPYVAPEVMEKNGEYDPRPLDVWGAAVVMLTLCANGCLWTEPKPGNSPMYDDLIRGWKKWNDKHADVTNPVITETDYPYVTFFDQHINPPALRRILLTMLNPNPAQRASMADIAKHRWLKNVECCQIDSYDDPSKLIDASKTRLCTKILSKVVCHNHLPPTHHLAHRIVRLPGATDMF